MLTLYMTNGWLKRRVHPMDVQCLIAWKKLLLITTTTMQIIKGGKCYLQRVNGNGPDKQDLILSICTPLMSHVHETRQAGEMAFMNSSGSLDRYNNPVFFMCTYHPCGALPLGVWVTSSKSQPCLENCLEKWKFILASHAFGGLRSPKRTWHFHDRWWHWPETSS